MSKLVNGQPLVSVKNIKKYFKTVKAVDGVSFEMGEGEFVALLGPNGAGKTTMVEMIEGIQFPDEGEIYIGGKQWHNHEAELHHTIGLSLQETNFFDKITTRETLNLFASFYKLGKTRVDEVLELIQLEEKQKAYVENLSGGQRQKLALGVAMLNNAKLLLLDEPTTGLDPTARREIWNILINLRKQHNTSMILTTHYMEEAEYLCDRIVVMDKGRILSQGTLEELLSQNNCYEIIEFSTHEDISDVEFLKDSGVYKYSWDDKLNKGKFWVFDIVSQLPAVLHKLQQLNYTLKSLECRKMTLDDLFIELTGRHLDQ
jgi:ABC-2 type transport system ATP-binding protein